MRGANHRRVMVTSLGSGVGRAIQQTIRASKHRYVITGTSSAALKEQKETVYLCPPTADSSGFERALFEAVEQQRPHLLLPGRDEDSVALATHAPLLAQLGAQVVGGPEQMTRAALDKAASRGLTPNLFVRTAGSPSEALALARDVGWPLVIKPRIGFASRGVRLVSSEAALIDQMGRDDIAQESLYLGDTLPNIRHGEHSVQVLLGRDSALLGVFHSVNELVAGRPTQVQTLPSTGRVINSLVAHLQELGGTGPWNFQGRRDETGHLRFFEVNARMTGISGLRADLGFNEVDLLYEAFVLEEVTSDCRSYPLNLVLNSRPYTDFLTASPSDQRVRR